jgi:hypothetical protein
MSDQPATPAPEKTKLSTLLSKVQDIAAGMDKNGVLPGVDGYDTETSPPMTMRWCASVLRVFLMRVIEHVVETRTALTALRGEVYGRKEDKEKGVTAIQSLASVREQMKEMSSLVKEIVDAIKTAQKMQAGGQAAPPSEEPAEGAPATNGTNGKAPPTPEQIAEAARLAEIDQMAAAAARGEKIPMPPSPVVPIKKNAKSKADAPAAVDDKV